MDVGLEAELKRNSGKRGLIVVDFYLVNDRRIEREIVRPIARLQKRIDTKDEGDAVRMVIADKRIEIGDVSRVIQRGNGRFPVA